ncbi:hypothetical protein IWX50DRAFT_646178 [Phyllosticta citricarpa]
MGAVSKPSGRPLFQPTGILEHCTLAHLILSLAPRLTSACCIHPTGPQTSTIACIPRVTGPRCKIVGADFPDKQPQIPFQAVQMGGRAWETAMVRLDSMHHALVFDPGLQLRSSLHFGHWVSGRAAHRCPECQA